MDALIHVLCRDTPAQVRELLRNCIENKGLRIFAEFEQDRYAAEAGLAPRPSTVLAFGNPAVGTLLMQLAPSIALDLPLKLLIWEDDQNRCRLTYRNMRNIARTHGLPLEHPIVNKLATLLEELGRKVAQQ